MRLRPTAKVQPGSAGLQLAQHRLGGARGDRLLAAGHEQQHFCTGRAAAQPDPALRAGCLLRAAAAPAEGRARPLRAR